MKKSLVTFLAAALAAAGPLVALAATTATASHQPAQHAVKSTVGAPLSTRYHAVGVVRSVDARSGKVMIAHEPIASLGWPAMVMAFQVRDPRLLAKLRAGSAIAFDFEQTTDGYLVTTIR